MVGAAVVGDEDGALDALARVGGLLVVGDHVGRVVRSWGEG